MTRSLAWKVIVAGVVTICVCGLTCITHRDPVDIPAFHLDRYLNVTERNATVLPLWHERKSHYVRYSFFFSDPLFVHGSEIAAFPSGAPLVEYERIWSTFFDVNSHDIYVLGFLAVGEEGTAVWVERDVESSFWTSVKTTSLGESWRSELMAALESDAPIVLRELENRPSRIWVLPTNQVAELQRSCRYLRDGVRFLPRTQEKLPRICAASTIELRMSAETLQVALRKVRDIRPISGEVVDLWSEP